MNVSIDDIIEERFNNYINKVTESGLPLWVAQMYGTAELYQIALEDIKDIKEDKEEDLPF
jgi:hypothetical protein